MTQRIRTTYRDAHGEIATAIDNDGRLLRLVLEGLVLEGTDFDSFELVVAADTNRLQRFTFASDALCGCTLEMDIPVLVLVSGREQAAMLRAQLVLGLPRADGGIDSESLRLTLLSEGVRVESRGRTGWFEDELGDIVEGLPPGWILKTCFGCGLSDYSPAGHGLFGGLACFRTQKQRYRAVDGKIALFQIWDEQVGRVQETSVCSEFEPRRPGAGYRG